MAKVRTDDKHYKNIANALREQYGEEKTFFPSQMPQAISEGFMEKYREGMENATKEWWDKYMDNLITWPYANKFSFAGKGWNDQTFKPTKSLRPYVCEMMFRDSGINDLAGILERSGVTFDFSRATAMSNFAYGSWITNFPLIDCSAATDLHFSFAYMTPHEMTGDVTLPLKVHEKLSYNYCFANSTRLVHLTIEGIIGNTIALNWSPLTKESIESVIEHLSDSALYNTATFNLNAVNKAFETSEGANDGRASEEWNTLVGSKPNWTIALANP